MGIISSQVHYVCIIRLQYLVTKDEWVSIVNSQEVLEYFRNQPYKLSHRYSRFSINCVVEYYSVLA